MITLNQKSYLMNWLLENENIRLHFDIDEDNCWKLISGITEKQYKFIAHLLIAKKYGKLNQILYDLNFPIKDHDCDESCSFCSELIN